MSEACAGRFRVTKLGDRHASDPSLALGAEPLPAADPLKVFCRGTLCAVVAGVCQGCGEQLNWLVTR